MAGFDHPLPIALSAAVPLKIAELKERVPLTASDFENVRPLARLIAEKGDQALYGGKETAAVFNGMVLAVATLAFVPGGITIFGMHWEEKNG